MANHSKKNPTSQQSSAKSSVASLNASSKAAKNQGTYTQPNVNTTGNKSSLKTAIEQSAHNVNKTMTEIIANSSQEVRKAQQEAIAFGENRTSELLETTDSFIQYCRDAAFNLTENVETAVVCSNASLKAAEELSSQFIELANHLFADSTQLSKDFFSCKTLEDFAELQSRAIQATTETTSQEILKLNDIFSRFIEQIMTPLSERMRANAAATPKGNTSNKFKAA